MDALSSRCNPDRTFVILLQEVVKWMKKPGESVKKGEALFELEVAGSIVIEMRAEVNGFMGPQLVPVQHCLAMSLLVCRRIFFNETHCEIIRKLLNDDASNDARKGHL
jgi:hypothetical protein